MATSIKDLLDSLPENSDFSNLPDWCKQLCEYYEENERHSYSEITEYIFKKKGGIEYVNSLLPTLKDIQNSMEDPEIRVKLGKLIDHIRLEVIRYEQIMKVIETSVRNTYMEMVNTEIEGFYDMLEEANEQAKIAKKMVDSQKANMEVLTNDINKVTELAEEAEKKVISVQTENVAILGIFASIVFAFTGLMTFTNSVLENIGGASAYRVFLVCLFIGFVFLNVIGVLVNGIKRIVYWKTLRERGKVIGTTLNVWLRENTLWLVGDIAILFLMFFTIYGWEHSSEKATQDISREAYIRDLQNNLRESVSGNDINDADYE